MREGKPALNLMPAATRVAELNGIDAGSVSKKFTGEPSVADPDGEHHAGSSDFLTRINIIAGQRNEREKIGIGHRLIASTTDTAGGARRQRRTSRSWRLTEYECDQINFDFLYRYKTQRPVGRVIGISSSVS